MRVALILLSIIALLFVGSVTWSLVRQGGGVSLQTTNKPPTDIDNIAIETWKNQIKTEEKIEKLSALVEELAKQNGTLPNTSETTVSSEASEQKEEPIKISGKLLALLMPTYTLSLAENTGILGLLIFETSIPYSTYVDEKNGLTVIPMNVSYDVFLKNIKAMGGKPYSPNEVKTFPFRSFYMNPETSDTLVRLVVEAEGQTVVLQIAKSKFNTLRTLLTKK